MCHDSSGAGAIHPNLEALDAGMELIGRCAWLVIDAGVVVLMFAFQGVVAVPVIVAQFVVNGAMFLSFQALPGGRPLPVPNLGRHGGGYCQCGGTARASPS